jgi:glycosyl transferase family 2
MRNREDILISAGMIVRNEAHHLQACLLSITGVVDEIVVVDTGSVDETPRIAESLGARVYEIPWQDDFTAARNDTIGRCRGAWILYIDADERIREGSSGNLRDLLHDPTVVGVNVWLHPAAGYTAYRELRLFRNHPELRFEGVIHENIKPSLYRYLAENGGRIADSALVLDHVGYHGEQAQKHLRNLPLLLKRLEREPDHGYCWWHLGSTYQEMGDTDRARKAWWTGVAASRRVLGLNWADSLSFIGLIELDFDQPEVTDPLLTEAMGRFPDHPHLVWLRGLALMRDSRFADAIKVLEELVIWRCRPRASDGLVSTDERLFGVSAFDALATCWFSLGGHDQAERYFKMAEDESPESLEYRVKRQLCATLARKAAWEF